MLVPLPALTGNANSQATLSNSKLSSVLLIKISLKIVFEDDHEEKIPNGMKQKMKCLWCGTVWFQCSCHKNDWMPPPAARDVCEALPGKDDNDAKNV